MRSSLGLAFGPAGRLSLFLFLALCSAPAIHCDHTLIECYASGGAVAFLIVSALLQAWMLSCAPEYRGTVVASLEIQKIKTDSTPDVFPQIYQRDEGTHLHLGVLIPGFASRDTCTMCAPRPRCRIPRDAPSAAPALPKTPPLPLATAAVPLAASLTSLACRCGTAHFAVLLSLAQVRQLLRHHPRGRYLAPRSAVLARGQLELRDGSLWLLPA